MGKKVFDIKVGYPKGGVFQPRCHVSNDTDIELVCHHCGIPIAPSYKGFTRGYLRKNYFYKKELLRLIKKANSEIRPNSIWRLENLLNIFKNREFSGLDLYPDEPIHCKKCKKRFHFSKTLNIIAFLAIAYALFFEQGELARVASALRLFVVLFGIILILVNWRFGGTKDTPKFPIIGRMPEVHVTEWINGTINLAKDGIYKAKIMGSGAGEIKFSTKVTSNDEGRLMAFKKTTLNRSTPRIYEQSAGFLLFQVARKINWIGNYFPLSNRVNTFSLTRSTSRSNHLEPFEVTSRYNFEFTPDEQSTLPVQIIPVIVSESDEQTALELTVQVNPRVTKSLSDADVSIVEFIINDPGLGFPQRTYPSTTAGENHNSLEWESVRLNTSVNLRRDDFIPQSNKRKSLYSDDNVPKVVFYVRFASPISTQTLLIGNLVVSFNKTFTGLDEIQLFTPLGYQVDPEFMVVKKNARIKIDFELDLHSIQVKRTYTKTKEYGQNNPILKIPNYKIVNKLVNALSKKQDIYVQRVIENPPATNKATAMMLNRFWEISGRKYVNGLFPIDFRILMTGKETYERGNDEPITGNLCFEITTNAIIVEGFIEKADNVFKELCATIERVLEEY